mmetsp:Transcript_1854/g.4829  ORF Transcript_1854/g.4829 Transcript_1854/m.4829 type:complete len:303 (-) Transcript_1854:409-1317(-)
MPESADDRDRRGQDLRKQSGGGLLPKPLPKRGAGAEPLGIRPDALLPHLDRGSADGMGGRLPAGERRGDGRDPRSEPAPGRRGRGAVGGLRAVADRGPLALPARRSRARGDAGAGPPSRRDHRPAPVPPGVRGRRRRRRRERSAAPVVGEGALGPGVDRDPGAHRVLGRCRGRRSGRGSRETRLLVLARELEAGAPAPGHGPGNLPERQHPRNPGRPAPAVRGLLGSEPPLQDPEAVDERGQPSIAAAPPLATNATGIGLLRFPAAPAGGGRGPRRRFRRGGHRLEDGGGRLFRRKRLRRRR